MTEQVPALDIACLPKAVHANIPIYSDMHIWGDAFYCAIRTLRNFETMGEGRKGRIFRPGFASHYLVRLAVGLN